jgi:hypothetical protein
MTELQAAEGRLTKLIEDLSESIQQELRDSATRIEAATRRNTAMIVSGTFAIGGLKRWAAPAGQGRQPPRPAAS